MIKERWEKQRKRISALLKRNKKRLLIKQKAINADIEKKSSALSQQRTQALQQVSSDRDLQQQSFAQSQEDMSNSLQSRVDEQVAGLRGLLTSSSESLRKNYSQWSDKDAWNNWQVPEAFPSSVPIADMQYSVPGLLDSAGWGKDPQEKSEEPGGQMITVAADLVLPDNGLLLVQGRDGIPIIHQAMLRLLAQSPLGKARFSLVDALGLGNNFSPFLQLQDQHEHLVGAKVRTSESEIERVLADLSEHAEKVIQKYLRDRHPTLADYNMAAGDLSEPYHVLVVADFPHGFSDSALARLASLIQHGPRCGIFVWLQEAHQQAMPDPIEKRWFDDRGLVLQQTADGWVSGQSVFAHWHCQPEPLPEATVMNHLLQQIGSRTASQGTLALPLRSGLPEPGGHWQRSCAKTLRIPLGRSGTDRIQEMELGKGTAQHVLMGGRTGSGKSTLLHALITAGAIWYHPDELQFYLIDFKKGVEFKTYAACGLPHAKVIAVESDREFGLSVLRALDEELDRRGTLYRQAEVQDLAGYRAACPDTPMPRTLLVIDEFHELFSDDDAIARDAALLLERFVRQGRAFGVHVVLGSQSLGGSSALARSTIGQMGVRIALQCSESDAQLILNEDNTAARLLERPGEAIYNDRSGMPEGNEPFQVFWIDDADQQQLLRDLPTIPGQKPRVFEGNAPALVADNIELMQALQQPGQSAAPLRLWLGEPNALKGPTEITLENGASGMCSVLAIIVRRPMAWLLRRFLVWLHNVQPVRSGCWWLTVIRQTIVRSSFYGKRSRVLLRQVLIAGALNHDSLPMNYPLCLLS